MLNHDLKQKIAKIFSKNNKIEIPVKDIVIDRHKFDQYLAKTAKKYGATIHLNNKFLGIENNNIVILSNKNNKLKKIKAEAIIGADGPLSDIAQANNLFEKREFYYGIQARVKGNYEPSCYEIYLGTWSYPCRISSAFALDFKSF